MVLSLVYSNLIKNKRLIVVVAAQFYGHLPCRCVDWPWCRSRGRGGGHTVAAIAADIAHLILPVVAAPTQARPRAVCNIRCLILATPSKRCIYIILTWFLFTYFWSLEQGSRYGLLLRSDNVCHHRVDLSCPIHVTQNEFMISLVLTRGCVSAAAFCWCCATRTSRRNRSCCFMLPLLLFLPEARGLDQDGEASLSPFI
jgi:hypothetical protein